MKNGKKYTIKFSKQASKDKILLKNAKLDKKCKALLSLMTENPFVFPPTYEKLSGDLKGIYSRRINRQHRLLYEIDEEKNEIHIIRMWTHYE